MQCRSLWAPLAGGKRSYSLKCFDQLFGDLDRIESGSL